MKTATANRLKNKNIFLSEDKNKSNINPKTIYEIYKKEFIDECDTIIIDNQKDFLDKYFNKIHLIIKNEYGQDIFIQNPSLMEITKKLELDFINEIYYPMYNSCIFGLKKYNSSKVHNLTKEYLTNFYPHCPFDQVPMHTCGSKFIYINNINGKNKVNNSNFSSYVLCIGCHKCYYDTCIKMYCPYCQMKFYSYLTAEKNRKNLYPATWKKYHCDEYINNEQMTCINCEDKLWIKDDLLICKKCKLEVKPEAIIWTCVICKKEFKSDAKIYNELEFKELNFEIKNALLYKRIAKPCYLPCKCLTINQISNIDFNHKGKVGCKGILYYGTIDNREFVICSLCKKMTFLNKFYWSCPICNINFISKKVKFYQANNSFINDIINTKNNINALTNKKYKKTQQNFYSHLFKTNSNNNTQRDIKKNDSYIRKYIEISSSNHKHNLNTEVEPTEKRRNNSLIITNRNSIINNKNWDSNASQGYYHFIHENKNNTSSTGYSSVSYYNNSGEREKDTHKKISSENNSSFRFNHNLYNKINEKKGVNYPHTNEHKKNNLSFSNKNEDFLTNNKKYNNYIFEYNNCNKKETLISSFNLRKGIKDQNKNNIIINKQSKSNIQQIKNKVYIPKKNINNNLSISINDEHNISSNFTTENKINNLKFNDGCSKENNYFRNKYRNLSGPKVNNSKIYINSKYKDFIRNNISNYSEIRQSSQPKIDINKYNINKILDESVNKSNASEISNNNIENKNRSMYFNQPKEPKYINKENNQIMNSDNKEKKSYRENISKYLNKRENIKNNSIKYFDNSIDIRRNISNKNNEKEKCEEQNDDDDELKEFNFDEYKIITQLGQGTFGKIYLVQDNSKQLFSMKKIVLSEELDVQSVIKEYRMCYKIKHPNVIKILGIYNNKLDKTTYVVYVLMEVGLTDWEKEIKKYNDKNLAYTEDELINIIKQLTSVLAFLQKKNISHRDIKPQNILVFKNKIYKIADFGEAKQIESISKSLVVNSLRGTELYMSPLLFNGLRTGQVDIKHNMFKSDVYSFGLCILYAACTTNKPLYETRKFVEMNSVKKYINKMLKNKYSHRFIKLLCTMIEIHEKNRPDFIELEEIMRNWKN